MGRVVKVHPKAPEVDRIELAERVLTHGGVAILPTDSVYGIGCLAVPGNPAHRRIFQIKQRPAHMKLPWLVEGIDDLTRFGADLPGYAIDFATKYWPGALTLVVKASPEVGEEYRAEDGTIALRAPDSVLVRFLAFKLGPLATTSANLHGEAAATTGADIDPALIEAADLTLDAGPAPIGVPSTIVDCTGVAPVILRQGAINL